MFKYSPISTSFPFVRPFKAQALLSIIVECFILIQQSQLCEIILFFLQAQVGLPGFEPTSHLLLAVWPEASYLTSLCLISKMRIIIVPTS